MKKLLLLRHGKSSWGYENISDIDRPLKNRGIRNSYEMATWLEERNISPDIIISSPAIRALHTATIFARVLKLPLENLMLNDKIYFTHEKEVLDLVKKTSNIVNTLLIVGHNPTFTSLVNYFVEDKIDNIPTAGIVELEFNTTKWAEINTNNLVNWESKYPHKEK